MQNILNNDLIANSDRDISYNFEILRKSIHLISLSIPISYCFLQKDLMLTILIILTIISIALDFASRFEGGFQLYWHKIFGKILRQHETKREIALNGATWVLISAVTCIYFFPKILFITGFSILILSDICAALFGKKFGRNRLFNKSWEGTSAFIISAILVVASIGLISKAPWTYFVCGIIASIIGGFAEASSGVLKIDDNISIPISIGLSMWLGAYISVIYGAPNFI